MPVPVATPARPTPPIFGAGGGAEEEGEGETLPLVQTCEGEEHVIVISFDAATMEPVEILIRHVEEDGTQSELRFDGDSVDEALELVDLLVAVEGCEWTEAKPTALEAVSDLAESATDLAE